MKQIIAIQYHTAESFTLNWSDEEFRYHVWLNRGGEPTSDTIYKNRIIPTRIRGERTIYLQISSKKWTPVLAAMRAEIVDKKLIEAAIAAEQAREAAAEEKRIAEEKARVTQTITAVRQALHDRLPMVNQTRKDVIWNLIQSIDLSDDETKALLVHTIEQAV